MVEKTIQAKALKFTHSYSTKTLNGHNLQKTPKDWTAFVEDANLFSHTKWLFSIFCSLRRWNDFLYWATGNKDLRNLSSRTLYWMKIMLSRTTMMRTMECEKTQHAGFSAFVYNISLFGPHRFGCFKQHALKDKGMLDWDYSVRKVDKQAVRSVLIPSVFNVNWAWRDTPFTLCNSCHRCWECGFIDV